MKTANELHFVSSNSLAVFRVFVQYVSEASRFPYSLNNHRHLRRCPRA